MTTHICLNCGNFVNILAGFLELGGFYFEVLIFSNQKFDFDNQCIKFFNLNNKNKKIQIYSIILCDIFLGPISGPFHVAKYLNKDLIITDSVIFNHYIHHNNFNIIYKN